MGFLMDIISSLLFVLLLAIIIRSIVSLFTVNPSNPLVIIPYRITEPIYTPLRRIIPKMGAFDLTPMAAMLLIWVLLNLIAWWSTNNN